LIEKKGGEHIEKVLVGTADGFIQQSDCGGGSAGYSEKRKKFEKGDLHHLRF